MGVLCAGAGESLAAVPARAQFVSNGKTLSYEIFEGKPDGALLIFLHGASGPGVPFYRDQAQYFAEHGFTVLFLHYFETGNSKPSDRAYRQWVQAVNDLVVQCRKIPEWSQRKIAVMGLSLGSSVALAVGSQAIGVDAVVDWYGSLPDEFFESRKGMPPLLILHGDRDPIIPVINGQQLVRLCTMGHYTCESHFYTDQGHGFAGEALQDADKRTLDFLARTLR
jgi:dienelactone hydrolase